MIRQKALKALAKTKFKQRPFIPTVTDCHLWTAIINHLLFAGAVPKYRKVTVKRLAGAYAYCVGKQGTKGQFYCLLEIHNRFPSFTSFYSALLHELIHAREWTTKGEMDHGHFFYSHQELANLVGFTLADHLTPPLHK